METILCLSSEPKGQPFLVEANSLGARVLLITEERHAEADWPRESIAARYLMPSLDRRADVVSAVSYLARSERLAAIVALDDYEVGTVAALREHLRLPGMGESAARLFRDKLAMRHRARAAEIREPAFCGIFHRDDIARFLETNPPPWVLKPRYEAGAVGIQRLQSAQQLWAKLDKLGDAQSNYLLEQFVPGDVFHVDSIFWEGKPQAILVSRYGRPPLSVSHDGGVFTSQLLSSADPDAGTLRALTTQLLPALGLYSGVAHTEYIRAAADGAFYFLETAARVGGAHIADLLEHATGINLWREWARIELATLRGERYEAPRPDTRSGALILCLAQQEWPDMSGYAAPEIVWRLRKPYHAGLIVTSPSVNRLEALVAEFTGRFETDFLATGPQKGIQRTQA